jgi:hypothetical protein
VVYCFFRNTVLALPSHSPCEAPCRETWHGTASQTGENVTIANASYNGAIAAGGSTSVGFQGTWTSSDAAPTAFTLNGGNCTR